MLEIGEVLHLTKAEGFAHPLLKDKASSTAAGIDETLFTQTLKRIANNGTRNLELGRQSMLGGQALVDGIGTRLD